MTQPKWDFQVERPVQDDGHWRISYKLIRGTDGTAGTRISIDERYPAAQIAIDEATRLAQIHVADLNGGTAAFEKPSYQEVPFNKHSRF